MEIANRWGRLAVSFERGGVQVEIEAFRGYRVLFPMNKRACQTVAIEKER